MYNCRASLAELGTHLVPVDTGFVLHQPDQQTVAQFTLCIVKQFQLAKYQAISVETSRRELAATRKRTNDFGDNMRQYILS